MVDLTEQPIKFLVITIMALILLAIVVAILTNLQSLVGR